MTRDECLRFEEAARRDGDSHCRYGFYNCLVERGLDSPAAWCAVGAASLAVDPTKGTALGALVTCGQQIETVYRACAPHLRTCLEGVADRYGGGVARCRQR